VVSDSVNGALWCVESDGSVQPGVGPEGGVAVPLLAGGVWVEVVVDGIPYALPEGFAPGVGSLARRAGHLYFGNNALGGLYRVPFAVFHDARTPRARGTSIEIVSPRPAGVTNEILKGIAFDPARPDSPYVWAGDPLRLRILRIHVATGAREVVATSPDLLNFPAAAQFLPGGGYFVTCDQEHRLAGLNTNLTTSVFELPFTVTEIGG
jgi:hypothetical protein